MSAGWTPGEQSLPATAYEEVTLVTGAAPRQAKAAPPAPQVLTPRSRAIDWLRVLLADVFARLRGRKHGARALEAKKKAT